MSIVRDGQRSSRGSIQTRDNRFFSPPKRPCWIRSLPGPLLRWCQGLFLWRQNDRMWRWSYSSIECRSQDEWNYTSNFPYDFMLIRGITLPLPLPLYISTVHLFDIRGSVHHDIIYENDQQSATVSDNFLFLGCSTCFERYFRSSSGASKLYLQLLVLHTCCCRLVSWESWNWRYNSPMIPAGSNVLV